MIIAWTLIPKDKGTLLILEHTGAENILAHTQPDACRLGIYDEKADPADPQTRPGRNVYAGGYSFGQALLRL